MADRDLSAHHVDQIIQIGAMHDVRQHRSVHLLVFVPVRAVQVRNIEIVALIAPTFVEDLFEFFFGIEVHAQSEIDASAAGLGRIAISVDDEQRRSWWSSRTGATATTSAATASGGAIDQFAAVGTDFEGSHAVDEACRAPVAQSIPNQIIRGGATTTSATTSALRAASFEVIDNSIGAGSQ